MNEYESSGLSQLDYCAREGHTFRQFKYYRSRFSQLAKTKTTIAKQPLFAPVSLSTPARLGLRIELGNGAYCLMQSPGDAILVKALLQGVRWDFGQKAATCIYT